MRKLIAGLTLLSMILSSCKDGKVVDIKAIDYQKDKTLFFGNTGDVIISNLPDSTIAFKWISSDSSFHWKMKHPAYFMINDSTQNAWPLGNIRSVTYRGVNFDLSSYAGALELFRNAAKGKKFAYLKLGNLLNTRRCKLKYDVVDSLNSIIAQKKNGDNRLILLDKTLSLTFNSGAPQTIITEGVAGKNGKEVKIAFFQVFNSKIFNPQDEATFHVGDTVFVTTAKAMFTPFGADKIFLRSGEKVEVSFNNFYRTVIPLAQINDALKYNHQVPVTIRQLNYATTYSNDIYVNNLAGTGYNESLTIDKGLNFHVAANSWLNENNLVVSNVNRTLLIWAFTPLVLVFLFGLFTIARFTRNDLHENSSNHSESPRWRSYFWILFICLFVLSCGRIYIGFNLSFTAPYFTFAFPTALIASPLIMLSVLYLWLIFAVNSGIEPLRLNFRFLIFFFSILLLALLYYIISNYFPLYFEGLKGLELTKFLKADTYYQNIAILLLLVAGLCTCLLSCGHYRHADRPKFMLNIILLVILVNFLVQNNSYSISALLIALFIFSVLMLPKKSPFLLISEAVGNASAEEKSKMNWQKPKFFLFALIPAVAGIILALLKNDPGYLINLMLFPFVLIFVLIGFHRYYVPNIVLENKRVKHAREVWVSVLGMLAILGLFIGLCLWMTSHYNPLDKGRLGSRFTAFYHFETVEDFGTRESEKQAQFFSELAKYTYPQQHSTYEAIHPGVASFIDPVVKNDLSAPFGLIYQFGRLWFIPVICLFSIWMLLLYKVISMSTSPGRGGADHVKNFCLYGLIRLYCACILVSSGVWLVLSYYNVMPFTGRLIYGMGQDSVAEMLETVFLFGFMGLISKSTT